MSGYDANQSVHDTLRKPLASDQPGAGANGEGDEGDRQPPAPHRPEPPTREDVPEVPDQREPHPEE